MHEAALTLTDVSFSVNIEIENVLVIEEFGSVVIQKEENICYNRKQLYTVRTEKSYSSILKKIVKNKEMNELENQPPICYICLPLSSSTYFL